MKPETLLSRTQRLLEESGLTYRQIAAGAVVDMEWLAKFKQNRIGEPGVNKVQRVHDFLVMSVATKTPRSRKKVS